MVLRWTKFKLTLTLDNARGEGKKKGWTLWWKFLEIDLRVSAQMGWVKGYPLPPSAC